MSDAGHRRQNVFQQIENYEEGYVPVGGESDRVTNYPAICRIHTFWGVPGEIITFIPHQ